MFGGAGGIGDCARALKKDGEGTCWGESRGDAESRVELAKSILGDLGSWRDEERRRDKIRWGRRG